MDPIPRDDYSPLPGELPLTSDARVLAIDLRTRDLTASIVRLDDRVERLDAHLADQAGKILRALATLTDRLTALTAEVPPREKLVTLSETDASHDALLAAHDAELARLRRAVGLGSVVGLTDTTLGTMALKLLAAKLGLSYP